jgi:excisionase family DNA binding protein
MSQLVRIEAVAERLGVSVPTVRVWIRRGLIPVYQADRIMMFNLEEVLAALHRPSSLLSVSVGEEAR